LIDILEKQIKINKISGLKHEGIWHDVGDVKKLKNVNNLFFNN